MNDDNTEFIPVGGILVTYNSGSEEEFQATYAIWEGSPEYQTPVFVYRVRGGRWGFTQPYKMASATIEYTSDRQ